MPWVLFYRFPNQTIKSSCPPQLRTIESSCCRSGVNGKCFVGLRWYVPPRPLSFGTRTVSQFMPCMSFTSNIHVPRQLLSSWTICWRRQGNSAILLNCHPFLGDDDLVG